MQNAETRMGHRARVPVSSFFILPFPFKGMNPAQYILVGLVRLYRWTLSPAKSFLFGPQARCRFTPSCSQYALESVKAHGAIAGGWLAVRRFCRCHPWGGCGHDPVPMKKGRRQKAKGRTEVIGGSAVKTAPGHSS